MDPEDWSNPLSFARGGPAMWSGTSFHGLIARAEILGLLELADGAVLLEPRIVTSARARQVGFDLLVRTDRPRYMELKVTPSTDDVVRFLRSCSLAIHVTDPAAQFLLVHDTDPACLHELRTLVQVAAEVDDEGAFRERLPGNRSSERYLTALGPNALSTLRRVGAPQHRPRSAEERVILATARHIVVDRSRSESLLDCLGTMVEVAAQARMGITLVEVRAELARRHIRLSAPAALPPDLVADALNRADNRCCVCHRQGTPVEVRLINGMASDHDPDNLVVLCASCHDASEAAAAVSPSLEAARLLDSRRVWDWKVAQLRRDHHLDPTETPSAQDEILVLLRAHLVEDFHWDGPRRGEFARLGGRMEDRFYQSNRGELLTARPAYYHTYWGLVGSNLILDDEFAAQAEVAADAVASRLAPTGWITVDLEDYSASPTTGRRRVETIRHTARAVVILHLLGRHRDLAREVAWRIIGEAEASMTDRGWREFRHEPTAPPSLYANLYVYQMLSVLLADENWTATMPESSSFRISATAVANATWAQLRDQWLHDRWTMNAMPWQVNAAAMLADIGPYLPDADRTEISASLRGTLTPTGRLLAPDAGDEWDAPEPILTLRIAFSLAQLGVSRTDERLRAAIDRLLRQDWHGVPLRTMDASFLAQLFMDQIPKSHRSLRTNQ